MNSYDHKTGNKTEALITHFNKFGGCSAVRLPVSMTDLWRQTQFTDMQQVAPKTMDGKKTEGLVLLTFKDVERVAQAKMICYEKPMCVISSLFHDKTNNVH